MGLLDAFRRRTATLAATETITPPALDENTGQWGGVTTSYSQRVADRLMPMLVDTRLTREVVKSMRRHPQVSACLGVQALPLLRADWTIECDDDVIREQVETWYGAIHHELMRSAARALWAGYSPNVLVWTVDPDSSGLMVRKIRDLDPVTCRPLTTDVGDYAGFVQNYGGSDEVTIVGEDVLRTLWIVEGMESGNLYGRSVLTAALQPWQDQQALNLYHLRGLERFGTPTVVSRAPEGEVVTNQAAINAAVAVGDPPPDPVKVRKLDIALEIAEGIRHNTAVSLPSSRTLSADGKDIGYAWSLEYLEAAADNAAAVLEGVKAKDADIARAILVPSLLLDGGDTVGSNALGQSHRDTFTENAQARLDDYAAQITRHLLDRLVDLNYGTRAARARLVFAPLSDDSIEHLWQVAQDLIASGKLPVDIPAIAARTGVPLDSEALDAMGTDPIAASPFSNVGLPALIEAGVLRETEARHLMGVEGDAPGRATPSAMRLLKAAGVTDLELDALEHCTHSLADDPADVSSLPAWKLPQSYDPPPFHRDPTARESLAVFRAIEDGLNGAEAETIAAIEVLLEGSRGRVLRQVDGIMRRGGTVAEIVSALSTVEIGATGPYADAWVTLQRSVWQLGLDSVRAQLEAFAELVPDKIGRDGMALVKAYASASAQRVTAELSSRVQLELVAAYRSGVSRAGLAAAVSDLFDREARGEGRGMRLTTRMLSARALNESRADAIERGGIPLKGAQYSALLDRRTCDLCAKLDEQVIAIGDTDLAKFTPPVHHNCRCVWVWITADEADFTPTWEAPPRSMVERYGSLVVG